MIKVIADKVLIKELSEDKVTKGGIVIPENARLDKTHSEGIVHKVGEGRFNQDGERIPLSVKVGDKVLYGRHSGSVVFIGEEQYRLLTEALILGVYEE